MLKNDTLKNGTSRIGLYGSAPPGGDNAVCTRMNTYLTERESLELLSNSKFIQEKPKYYERRVKISVLSGTFF